MADRKPVTVRVDVATSLMQEFANYVLSDKCPGWYIEAATPIGDAVRTEVWLTGPFHPSWHGCQCVAISTADYPEQEQLPEFLDGVDRSHVKKPGPTITMRIELQAETCWTPAAAAVAVSRFFRMGMTKVGAWYEPPGKLDVIGGLGGMTISRGDCFTVYPVFRAHHPESCVWFESEPLIKEAKRMLEAVRLRERGAVGLCAQ